MWRLNAVPVWLAITLCIYAPLTYALDYVEVRENGAVYQQPNKRSTKLLDVDLSGHRGPYVLRLATEAKVNGYYKVQLPGRLEQGWIYKTYVRRYSGKHPKYVAYSRSYYQHWVDHDSDCQDTRNEVLIRDAAGEVTYRDGDKCVVVKGTWNDPYSGKTYYEPRQLDVDHVVPLKNAHESGAWAWSKERRRDYANYLAANQHLLAVLASENRRKGDKGPDRYLPPNTAYRCDYVRLWMKIKQDWQLEMTEAEGEAVQRILETCS